MLIQRLGPRSLYDLFYRGIDVSLVVAATVVSAAHIINTNHENLVAEYRVAEFLAPVRSVSICFYPSTAVLRTPSSAGLFAATEI